MDKIERATEIHSTMTPHQMALYIVEIDEVCDKAAKRIAELQDALDDAGTAAGDAARKIKELQDALELAEEAVLAKQQPEALDGWKLVPVEPTIEMVQAATHSAVGFGTRSAYKAMLAAAPKPEGGAA